VVFETSHRKEDVSCVVSRVKRGDDLTKSKGEVKGSIDIAGFAGWVVEFNVLLDREIHYV
jgi:hypothetical protein